MDFLDPKKQRRHNVILFVGYVLIGIAILIGTTVLLYESYGFGFGKNGKVIQSGLLFFSSQPNPAKIYLNGKLNKAQTNSRVVVPAGQYTVTLSRTGYRDWERQVTVQGGDVQHFDYPFLFPKTLKSTSLATYVSPPGLATQSPDQRWLLVQQPGVEADFDLYDLKNPAQPASTVSLPTGVLSKGVNSSWKVVEWADDNQHVLLQHDYDSSSEFIVLDRQNPDQSVNLDKTFNVTPTSVNLDNKKYDQYYLYNSTTQNLDTASLKTATPSPFLQHVLAYKSYGDTTMLYATDAGAAPGKAMIDLQQAGKSYPIRQVPLGTTYLLDMASYNGTPYVVLGAASENEVFIYKDPLSSIDNSPSILPPSLRVLRVANPNYVSFSSNAQFIATEGAEQFAVFDIEHTRTYSYVSTKPLDPPQVHATWMDGDRLVYISGGKLVVFDYDHANQQTLVTATPGYLPFFAPDYHYVYSLGPANTGTNLTLSQTPLLTPSDL